MPQLLAERVRRKAGKAKRKLCVDPPQFQSGGHAVNRQHISSNAVIYLVGFGVADHFVKRAFHYVQEPLVDFAFAPEESLAVLNPFEIADGDAAGVAENVRDSENAFGINDSIGLPGGGAVGALAKDFALHLMGVLLGDLVFDGRGNEHIARLEEHVARAHLGATAREFLQRLLVGVNPFNDFRNVKTFFVVQATANVGEPDDLIAGFLHQCGGERADIAESLNNDPGGFFFHPQLGQRLVHANHHAAAGGFAAATRTAQFDGLAGDDRGGGLARVHRVGVHHPGHGLLVGADIRRWNIALGAQPIRKFGGVAPGEALEFTAGHFARVANDATFGAAKRDVYHRAFPGHPGGERAYFINADIRGKTNSTLTGPPYGGVQHAIPGENFELSAVHADRDVQGDFLVGIFQVTIDALFEAEFVGSHFKTQIG